MSQLLTEERISLAELAAKIRSRRRVGSISPQAVWRWARRGVNVDGVGVVRLETVRLAGRYLTSWEAFQRFITAQTPPNPVELPARRSIAERATSDRMAAEKLEAAGV